MTLNIKLIYIPIHNNSFSDMYKTINKICILFAMAFPGLISGQTGDLEKNFADPPNEYSLLPFWSWNGTLKPDKLKWQIDQMMEKGIYGAFMHARAGLDESETPYFSEGFWDAVDTTIRYSALKGFQACLYDEDKWPSGSAGGLTLKVNREEFIKKALVYNKMEVVGPQTIRLNLQMKPMAVFAGRITTTGSYDHSSQIDLTDKAAKEWNVPEGRWAIISFEMVQDPDEQIDYLDSAAVARFIEITHEEYYKRFGKYFGNTIPGIFFDEIYANLSKMGTNIFWTDDFLKRFRKLKGYGLTDNLPLIIFNDPEKSAKIRYDYFDVVKELYLNAWFKQYADWCAQHKIWATGHTAEKLLHYKREADYFTTMGQLQVPGADNEEYRYGFPRMIDWYNAKQISSIANLYDRERVMAEAMGGGGYIIPLEEYRYGFAMLAVYGINMFIPHLFHYTMDTPESQADWPPSWFFRNPYWKYFKPLADFASRLSFMNSQGKPVIDVAILYPLTDLWVNGYPERIDDTFYKEVQQKLIDSHIEFDIIDPESLSKASVEKGNLRIGKGEYRLLILPAIHAIRTDVGNQINNFVELGGTVIALKDIPQQSENGTGNDELVATDMRSLFGIAPFSLRAGEYYQWNNDYTEHYTFQLNRAGGAALFSRFLNQLPEMINSRIIPDFEVKSENARFLRFNHRQVDGKEIYLLVNERSARENYLISLRNSGVPSIWNPETGNIEPIDNYQVKDRRLEVSLDFGPRECYYLVIDQGKPDSSRVIIEKTQIKEGQAIPLDGDWQFQLAQHVLDYQWSPEIEADTIALPVMKFKVERHSKEGTENSWSSSDFNDSTWKTVKVVDVFNKIAGIQRYLSHWDAWWISYYDPALHIANIEGGDRTFKKQIRLETTVKEARLDITADHSYELIINGKTAGSDNNWENVESYILSEFFHPGENTIEIKTRNTRGLLFEGNIVLLNGKNLMIRSDDTWIASAANRDWRPAFQFAAPPLGSWGNIAKPGSISKFPVTVWYRQQLPPGAFAIRKPVIKGEYRIYINGVEVTQLEDKGIIDFNGSVKPGKNVISVMVIATDEQCGLIQPIEAVCGKVTIPLIPWNMLGQEWYSGRAIYTKKVEIQDDYLHKENQVILNLGKVNYFAEIWVNGKLVTYCPWPPYEANITDYLKKGSNNISVVVANLQANEATWNILDKNINNQAARWWHNGSIMREKDKLVSGLLGSVSIIISER